MKIVGLITEYNPFHNGHLYHIERAKEITGADAVIAVMSGDFVQRGEPAVMPKRLRTQAALEAGISVVLELPVCYATGSAEYFARGAVALLDSLGCVDSICFGSESGEIKDLEHVAEILVKEPLEYRESLQRYLREGYSFPRARQMALEDDIGQQGIVLDRPNNILGIEYLKAMYRLNSRMKAYTIRRVVNDYHEEKLQEKTGISSASAIRKALDERSLKALDRHVPDACMRVLRDNYELKYPVWSDDISLLLKYCLLNETRASLMQYMDITEDLSFRIMNHINEYTSFDQFCGLLKSKELTYARISRSLLHILLNITCDDMEDYKIAGDCLYAHILGFGKDNTEVLGCMKQHAKVPLLTKLSDAEDKLDETGRKMLRQDIFASNLYESVITEKYRTDYINEYQQQIVRV